MDWDRLGLAPLLENPIALQVASLSGLGAMTAVLLLIFKDTIPSLVASVQLTGNDMLEHLFAVAPDFGLHTFQNPSGQDLRGLTDAK